MTGVQTCAFRSKKTEKQTKTFNFSCSDFGEIKLNWLDMVLGVFDLVINIFKMFDMLISLG